MLQQGSLILWRYNRLPLCRSRLATCRRQKLDIALSNRGLTLVSYNKGPNLFETSELSLTF